MARISLIVEILFCLIYNLGINAQLRHTYYALVQRFISIFFTSDTPSLSFIHEIYQLEESAELYGEGDERQLCVSPYSKPRQLKHLMINIFIIT